ncbi:MAG: YdcF family protein [Pseudolabrys sp.]|nr:YdcF family protein [Pseudolabrys sp.]
MLSSFVRWIGYLTIVAALAGLLALTAGFFGFVSQISDEEPQLYRAADGIVALTGAASRIPDALVLLTNQRGRRLLITGVHPTTTGREIAQLTALNEKVFACCVDLDRSALNTYGNAVETRRWAREKGFNSLIVVTSNWHMPRAMAEIEHQLPDVTLVPYPVVSDKVKGEPWWSNSNTARLLIGEYLKYVFALVRNRLDPDVG